MFDTLNVYGYLDSLLRGVALVAHEDFARALVRVLVHLLDPGVDVVEGLAVPGVVDHDDPVRAAVVRGRDRAEPLLPGGVPDLELDGLPLNGQRAEAEVHADGGDVAVREAVVREPQEEAGLAHPGVPEQHELEEVVVVATTRWRRHREALAA